MMKPFVSCSTVLLSHCFYSLDLKSFLRRFIFEGGGGSLATNSKAHTAALTFKTDISEFTPHAGASTKLQYSFEGFAFLFSWSIGDKRAYLLFEGARLRIFGHHVMQGLNGDVDDATELVLDHTEDRRSTPTYYSWDHIFNGCVLECKQMDACRKAQRAICPNKQTVSKRTMTAE